MYTWKGWTLPEGTRPGGGWIDLSQPVETSGHAVAYFDQPTIRKIASIPERPFNVTEITTYCHFGTHVDAPCHFIADGPSIDRIPLSRLVGTGTVLRIEAGRDEEIGLDRLLAAGAATAPGDMLVLDTGWARHYGTEAYVHHPYLAPDVAEWLVRRRIKLVAMDTLGPDLPIPLRGPGFSWPAHGILLSNGVLIAENLTNLAGLAGRHLEILATPLNIVGSDGGPARIVARHLEAVA